jgi:hypothetical protein
MCQKTETLMKKYPTKNYMRGGLVRVHMVPTEAYQFERDYLFICSFRDILLESIKSSCNKHVQSIIHIIF